MGQERLLASAGSIGREALMAAAAWIRWEVGWDGLLAAADRIGWEAGREGGRLLSAGGDSVCQAFPDRGLPFLSLQRLQ